MLRMEWWYAALFYIFYLFYISIILWLVWTSYGGGVTCFTCNWYGLVDVIISIMIIMALSVTTWSNVVIFVLDYVKYENIYIHVKQCENIFGVFYWCYLGDHVRLWLWLSIYSLRVLSWLLLLDYMSLWCSYWWW